MVSALDAGGESEQKPGAGSAQCREKGGVAALREQIGHPIAQRNHQRAEYYRWQPQREFRYSENLERQSNQPDEQRLLV